MPGKLARVACIYHAIECVGKSAKPWDSEIEFETMNRAANLMKCSVEHSKFAFASMGADESIEPAKMVLRWMQVNYEIRNPPTVRKIFNAMRGRAMFAKVERVTEALQKLEEHGYTRFLRPDHKAPGRPPSPVVELNPKIIDDWANSADIADIADAHPDARMITDKQKTQICELQKSTGVSNADVCKSVKARHINQLTQTQAVRAIRGLELRFEEIDPTSTEPIRQVTQ